MALFSSPKKLYPSTLITSISIISNAAASRSSLSPVMMPLKSSRQEPPSTPSPKTKSSSPRIHRRFSTSASTLISNAAPSSGALGRQRHICTPWRKESNPTSKSGCASLAMKVPSENPPYRSKHFPNKHPCRCERASSGQHCHALPQPPLSEG